MTTSPISPANLEPAIADLLRGLERLAATHGVDFFVCGAYARDLILEGVHGIRALRATRDVDLALAVPDWATHDRLLRAATEARLLDRIGDDPQKFRAPGAGVPVDVIAFGGVEAPAGSVAMPPDGGHRMTVIGFADVAACTVAMDVGEHVEIAVASLHGLAILKVIAWSDRGGATAGRDAIDLAFLLRHYGHPVMSDRLHSEALALLEDENYDTMLAGARLLGRDMAEAMSPETSRVVEAILTRESAEASGYRLALAMAGRDVDGEGFERSMRLIERLLAGARERGR